MSNHKYGVKSVKIKEYSRDKSQDNLPAKKKSLGQHFLRKQSVVDHMIDEVTITPQISVMEIGCGDGFLTRAILEQTKCKQLWVYEIDPEWAHYVQEQVHDPRLKIFIENVLDLDVTPLKEHTPWVLLANLPYQVTFPILYLILRNKYLFNEGVVMMQEEVAQKLVATSGRSCTPVSLFLQYNFEFKLLEKIEPGAFSPPPKVFSRLVYFKPKLEQKEIPNIEDFWKFIKQSYRMPRRTLHNNLRTTHYDITRIPETILTMRSQQLSFEQFCEIWQLLHKTVL